MTTYRLVPVEPSEEMREAGYRAVGRFHYSPDANAGWGEQAIAIYKAMLQAAPVTQNELLEAAKNANMRLGIIADCRSLQCLECAEMIHSVIGKLEAAIRNTEQGDTTP